MNVVNTPDTGSDSSSEPDMLLTMEIPPRADFVALVRTIVAAAANSVEVLSGERLNDLRVVVSEATTNAIEANVDAVYAAGLEEIDENRPLLGSVKIACDVSGGRVKLEVRDSGPGLGEPVPLPDITSPDRLFIEGGFGIPLIEHLSSLVDFKSASSGTTVTIEMHQQQ